MDIQINQGKNFTFTRLGHLYSWMNLWVFIHGFARATWIHYLDFARLFHLLERRGRWDRRPGEWRPRRCRLAMEQWGSGTSRWMSSWTGFPEDLAFPAFPLCFRPGLAFPAFPLCFLPCFRTWWFFLAGDNVDATGFWEGSWVSVVSGIWDHSYTSLFIAPVTIF